MKKSTEIYAEWLSPRFAQKLFSMIFQFISLWTIVQQYFLKFMKLIFNI